MFTRSRARALGTTIGIVVTMAAVWAATSAGPANAQAGGAEQTVSRIGDYVTRYYERAQTIVADESVTVQPIGRDFAGIGFPRRLVYEFRLEFNPAATGDDAPATVTRQLISVNGKPPKPRDEPKCLDPRTVAPEPLVFLLPERRHKFTFTSAGLGRIDGRPVLMVDYKSNQAEKPTATIDEKDKDCIMFDLPGRARGRVWVHPETAEIVRLDEQLIGMVDVPAPRKERRRDLPMYWTIERADSSMIYERVKFQDPEETISLPARIVSVTIINGGGSQRTRFTQTFTNYRRFITGSRVVQ